MVPSYERSPAVFVTNCQSRGLEVSVICANAQTFVLRAFLKRRLQTKMTILSACVRVQVEECWLKFMK